MVDYRVVNGTATIIVVTAICLVSINAASGGVGVMLGLALTLPAVGLFEVATILKQQGQRITRLEQMRAPPAG
jgi:hypothetical protein